MFFSVQTSHSVTLNMLETYPSAPARHSFSLRRISVGASVPLDRDTSRRRERLERQEGREGKAKRVKMVREERGGVASRSLRQTLCGLCVETERI